MRELRIDADKAERIISQTLRDAYGMLPAKANEAAAELRRRLDASMTTPSNQVLSHYRLIGPSVPPGIDHALWKRVYDLAEDLPPGVAEAVRS